MKTGRPKKNTSATTVRVDFDLKRQAEEICDEMGISLSGLYVMLLKAVVRTRSIPFKLVSLENSVTKISEDDD